MKIVGKYLVPFKEQFSLELPKGAEIVRIDTVEGHVYLWAVIDTEAPLESVEFVAQKTGGEIPAGLSLVYIGCAAIHIQMELMLYFFRVVGKELAKPKKSLKDIAVGDRVKVVGSSHYNTTTVSKIIPTMKNGFLVEMRGYIGRVYVVESISKDVGVRLVGGPFSWLPEWLEYVE